MKVAAASHTPASGFLVAASAPAGAFTGQGISASQPLEGQGIEPGEAVINPQRPSADGPESSPGGTSWDNPPAAPASDDWLNAMEADTGAADFDWLNPFGDQALVPLDVWVDQALAWVVTHFRDVFQIIRQPIDITLRGIESALLAIPEVLMLAVLVLIAWQVAGRRLALGSGLAFVAIGLLGIWSQAMITLALVLTSVVFCVVIGIPLGILMARSDRLANGLRPLLDAMQTTPAFVYLVPVVMLFGIGNVPGVLVTIIFALPPLIRLTHLGIRTVRADLVEAAHAFGATEWQLLTRVQLPLAMPTIMAGVNQTLMLSLSMVVIASMIAVGGLGEMVLRGIGRLDMGLATVGGLGIVLMAIVLDRLTQALSTSGPKTPMVQRGPLGALIGCSRRLLPPAGARP